MQNNVKAVFLLAFATRNTIFSLATACLVGVLVADGAAAVISGLVVSTLLTLFVIPAIYTQVSRLRTALGREEKGLEAAPAEGASFETS